MKHAVVILAAGKGTRMKSRLPKVLHPLLGRPMLAYVVEAAVKSGAERVVVVVGHGAEMVKAALDSAPVTFVEQKEQLGTAHALLAAKEALSDFSGAVLVTSGDTPLLSAETLKRLAGTLERQGGGMVLLALKLDDPFGYGRVVRDARGQVARIVEEKDASPEERQIQEVNSGVYAFDPEVWTLLPRVRNDNRAGEYYLPDLVALYREAQKPVGVLVAEDESELLGVNTRAQLAEVEGVLLARLRRKWMEAGVRMHLPETIYLEPTVELAPDVVLEPGVILAGQTRVGEGARIGAYSVVRDSELAPGAEVRPHSVLEGARLAEGAVAGPFARLRPGAELAEGAFVGNFVEVKKSRLGPGVKAGHLAYLGDAEVGAGTNVGAGVITANYDGENKHPTHVGEKVFIGSNSVLIAPVRIGDGAFVAGGSAINQDVPEGALAIARARQRNVEGWAKRKKRYAKEQEVEE